MAVKSLEVRTKIAGIDPELWTGMRMLAAARGTTIKKLLRECIAQYLRQHQKEMKAAMGL